MHSIIYITRRNTLWTVAECHIHAKRQSTMVLELVFLDECGTNVGIAPGSLIKFAAKTAYDSIQFLVFESDYVIDDSDPDNPVYVCTAYLDNATLIQLLGNSPYIDLLAEVQVNESGLPYKAQTIHLRIHNSVIVGAETTDGSLDLKGPKGDPGEKGDPGPQGPPGEAAESYEAENKDTTPISAGMAVWAHSSGSGVSRASRSSGRRVAGVYAQEAAPGFAAPVRISGVLYLTDWTAATGSALLAVNSFYFLADNGLLTTLPTTMQGQILQEVGYSLSTQHLNVHIGDPILL